MNTRKTSDYTPTMRGSKEENQAYAARREMMKWFGTRPEPKIVRRKTWQERMLLKAKGFEIRD